MAQSVKNLPAMQETHVRALNQEYSPGEGNGHPLYHSYLANPVDRGTWWAIVHGVAKSDMTKRAPDHDKKQDGPLKKTTDE